jgi:hypothetical protein
VYPIWFIVGNEGVVGSVIFLLNVHDPFIVVAEPAPPINMGFTVAPEPVPM